MHAPADKTDEPANYRWFLSRFADELLLNSGQYALFYILMNFSDVGMGYFQNLGHTLLLFILIFQTSLLVMLGSRPARRFFLSLIAPAMYTLIEMREGMAFVLNMGHMFFWFSSIVTGAIQAAALRTDHARWRQGLEFSLTLVNVAIFMLVYFYFDTRLVLAEQLAHGWISREEFNALLQITEVMPAFGRFIGDPAHVFVLAGGGVLAVSLAVGRVRILKLSQRIAELFGRYVDRDVRDRILSHGGETISDSREVAVLFSDIRSFTSLSEHESPEAVTAMLNEYFSWWDREIVPRGGIIDKYIGDAVMVVFGLGGRDAACENAVRCALAMEANMPALKRRLAEKGLPLLKGFGVGINYGPVIVGDIGSENRRNFTVIGDAVNVASRLESHNKSTGSVITVSESVYQALPDGLRNAFVDAGTVALKGREDDTRIYTCRDTVNREG